MPVPNTTESSNSSPSLKIFLNTGTLWDLPETSAAPKGTLKEQYQAIRHAGFEGLQDGDIEAARNAHLSIAGSGRVNHPEEVEPLVEKHLQQNFVATTLHVAWGTENDNEVDQLVSKIIETSNSYNYPLYIETHRATITQDNWRTLQIAKRFPEIRFNGDFSHWYTGHEMVYGDWEEKIQFIKPVLDRVRFIHGRIATPGLIQAPISTNPNAEYIQHFREIWRRCFQGFLDTAQNGDYLIFAPELLPPKIYYAQSHLNEKGEAVENSDRWEDTLLLKKIAEEEFANALGS